MPCQENSNDDLSQSKQQIKAEYEKQHRGVVDALDALDELQVVRGQLWSTPEDGNDSTITKALV